MTPWTDSDLDDFQDLPPNRLEDAALWMALVLILGSAVAAYHGLISTLAAVGLMALAGACCLVVEWVRWRP